MAVRTAVLYNTSMYDNALYYLYIYCTRTYVYCPVSIEVLVLSVSGSPVLFTVKSKNCPVHCTVQYSNSVLVTSSNVLSVPPVSAAARHKTVV